MKSVSRPEPESPTTDFRHRERQAGETRGPADRTSCDDSGVLGSELEGGDDGSNRLGRLESQHETSSRGRDPYGNRFHIESAAQRDQPRLDGRPGFRRNERQAIERRPQDFHIDAMRRAVRGVVVRYRTVGREVSRPGLYRAAGSSIGCIHVPGNRECVRSDGCRRNCLVLFAEGSVVTPSGPLSPSVIPGHDRVFVRTLIAGSR